jgi:hypothetical protein
MTQDLLSDLIQTMAGYGFREVPDSDKAISGVGVLLKRQTWNTNRAIVVVSPAQTPLICGPQ